MTNPLVFFAPSGKRGRFPEGTSLLEAARKLGVDLDSVCGGRGICGRCQVEVGEGKFSKLGIVSASGPRHRLECRRGALRLQARAARRRPAARLPGEALRRRRHRRSAGQPGPSPGRAQERRHPRHRHRARSSTLHYVEVREPDMHDPSSDFRRLQEALEEQWGLKDVTAPLEIAAPPADRRCARAAGR